MSGRRRPHSRAEKRNSDELKARRLQPCARCGQRINYSVEWPHPDSFIAGHIKSWHDYPHLRLDPTNLQPEHTHCGTSAKNDDGGASTIGSTSRAW